MGINGNHRYRAHGPGQVCEHDPADLVSGILTSLTRAHFPGRSYVGTAATSAIAPGRAMSFSDSIQAARTASEGWEELSAEQQTHHLANEVHVPRRSPPHQAGACGETPTQSLWPQSQRPIRLSSRS